MPQPTPKDVHVDRILTGISVAYIQDVRSFVAERIFPRVPVAKQSDSYFVYDKGYWFRDEAQKRGPGSESAGGGYGVSTAGYRAEVWAFHKDVDNQTRANTDSPLDADRDATAFVTQKMLLKREKLVLGAAFTTGVWTGSSTGTDITPGTKWSAANSTPIEDIEAEAIAMYQKTGNWPNRLIVGIDVYKALKNHAAILDRIKYTERGMVSTRLLATLLAPPDVDNFEVFVVGGIENVAKEGAADDMQFIADPDDALLLHAPSNPGLQTPSAGYMFTWTGLLGASAFGVRIARIPTPLLGEGSERVEAEMAFDPKVVAPELGVFFNEATL